MTHARTTRAVGMLAGAAIAALVSVSTATAGRDSYKVRMTAEGQAAARAVMPSKADIGAPSDWKGGPTRPDVSNGLKCANYHPKVSDLVVTGAAAVTYKQPGLVISVQAAVLASGKMARLDWKRSVGARHYADCSRAKIRKSMTAKQTFVSLRRLAIPHLATVSSAYRTLVDVKTKIGKVRMAIDVLIIGRGRTEMAMITTMPLASVPTLAPNELVLAKTLAGRIRL
jgi:hypothetical protein